MTKSTPATMPSEALDELDLRPSRSTRREHVVEDDDPRTLGDCVAVHLQAVGAVLERVRRLDGLTRQLSGLPRRDEAGPELVRERRAEDEPARLGTEDEVGLARPRPVREPMDRLARSTRDRR